MFTLTFALKDVNKSGDYPIKIVPTIINDTSNGWPPEGAPVTPLVGAKFDVPLDEAFPTLLSAEETDKMGEGLIRFKQLLPSGPQTFSIDVAAGAEDWIEVLTVPEGYRARITHIFYVMDQAITYNDYGAVFLRWRGEEKHFSNLWFFYKQPTNRALDLYINAGQTLEAYPYKKTSTNVPSVLSFTVEWERVE
jgi:hypothetical protein